jgi:protein ImuB
LDVVIAIAQAFSPRFERRGEHLIVIDVSGLTRLVGPAEVIGQELRRELTARGIRGHVAVAGTQTAAILLAQAKPGLTVIAPGDEATALAPLAIELLDTLSDDDQPRSSQKDLIQKSSAFSALSAVKRWGLRTLGEFAALPPAELVARLGKPALAWQASARGADRRPLVPMLDEERFESSLDLEWPIEELEPLSFVLTRLLEPLSTRLERRDRGAAVLHVLLRLVTRETCARRLELPTPMRDVRTLRTLALLDLESHPAEAPIDRVTIVIDPTPGRVLQHTLFTRAHPTPEQLSTLVARLGAVMGQDRFGAPATVETYRPGAFAMKTFSTDHDHDDHRRDRRTRREENVSADPAASAVKRDVVTTAVRRCRQPVPARVALDRDGRPVRVTTDRRGYAGGAVIACAGPWRTSGHWWAEQPTPTHQPHLPSWDRDEWDVALGDGAAYRIFQDRARASWFIDAIVD